MRLNKKAGFTLLELMIAMGISVTLIASLVMAFLGMKITSAMSRQRMQAMQVVRGVVEELKATPFASIATPTAGDPVLGETGSNGLQYQLGPDQLFGTADDVGLTVAYDAGPNGTFGNADDLTGTLKVTVRDFLDMDNDGNTAETSIDINGDGVNDPTYARPVRVSFTWTQYVMGASKTFTVNADTLVAA